MSSLRLVLVGMTGAGKSSAGNTILGKKEFKAGFSFNGITTQCQKGEGEVEGRTVTVVDTPGVTDITVSREDAKDRVADCFPMSAPGTHAFLLVIKLGRFTPEEKQAADMIREVFGEAALKHTIVLFTHGDELEDPDDVETLLSGCVELTYLLDKLNWRYHVFNNKTDDRTQVIQLLNKIDKMVGEQGRYYTRELFQKAEEKRKEEQEKERLRREEEELRQDWNKKPELRILLVGKSTASTRTASKLILEERHQYSDTEGCQKINGQVLWRRVSVVETSGLSDTCRRSEKEIMHEILSCIRLTAPGPHAFVIVERSREESAERKGILNLIKDVFGDQALKYVILLAIESREKHVHNFDYEYSHSTEHLPTHIFEDSRNLKQITSLLQKIDRMVERNGGSFFTNDMYSEVEGDIRQVQNKILEKISKEKCGVKWGGKDVFKNNLEWKKTMVKPRRLAENNVCVPGAAVRSAARGAAAVGTVAVGTVAVGAAALGAAAVGAAAVGAAAVGAAAVGAAAGAAAVGAAAGEAAAVGAVVGVAVGGAVAVGAAAVEDAVLGLAVHTYHMSRAVAYTYRNALRNRCNMQ